MNASRRYHRITAPTNNFVALLQKEWILWRQIDSDLSAKIAWNSFSLIAFAPDFCCLVVSCPLCSTNCLWWWRQWSRWAVVEIHITVDNRDTWFISTWRMLYYRAQSIVKHNNSNIHYGDDVYSIRVIRGAIQLHSLLHHSSISTNR